MQNIMLTKILFYEINFEDIETEGIKYAEQGKALKVMVDPWI